MNYNKKTVYDVDVKGQEGPAPLRFQRAAGQGDR